MSGMELIIQGLLAYDGGRKRLTSFKTKNPTGIKASIHEEETLAYVSQLVISEHELRCPYILTTSTA